MQRSELEKILAGFSRCSLAVLGDVMLDEFCWGKVDRISPEAPVPIVQVKTETWRPGGAANVASNLTALGARAHIFGLVGDDGAGRRLTEELQKDKIGTAGLIIDSGRRTSVKTRILGQNQQMIRVDRENTDAIDYQRQKDLLSVLLDMTDELDGVIVSDYAKGVIVDDLFKEVVSRFRKLGKFIAVDPKLKNFPIYKKPTIITPNTKEAEAALGRVFESEADVMKGGVDLQKATGADAILITRSEQGMSLFEKGHEPITIPTRAIKVFDVTGAGDTVISTFSLGLASGCNMRSAAEVANLAAGVVVGIVGTAAASREQVLEHYDSSRFAATGKS
ncbi:MAG TPA: D-glycero-beta-D-manno-heptose-7-phosphate kinase [Candidatus Rifleibacterium sp.]|nr:D-glycero-beta-D-manno-heptose-7-phosphate kinase [Candidatus Rifleibacterium sp.]HPT44688.1 D-glycero-beta-D-manno-heptose-7-phosphate kinase [Candidatus Rifleibacterium sp.]